MSSDLDKHKQWLRDMSGRTNLEALAAIEALEGEVARWKREVKAATDIRVEAEARAERLRVAITTAIANMDHDYAYEVLCKAVAEECSVSPVKYTGGMNDLCVSAVGDDVRASELLRKALASVDRHMTDAIICLAAGGTKGSATNILNRAVDIARTALQDNKQ